LEYCLIPAALADGCSGTVLSPVEVLQSLVAHHWTIDFQQQVMGRGWARGGLGVGGGVTKWMCFLLSGCTRVVSCAADDTGGGDGKL